MVFRSVFLFLVLISALAVLSLSSPAHASDIGQDSALATDTQAKIQTLFNGIQTVGDSYNAGGGAAAERAALDAGCRAGLGLLSETGFLDGLVLESDGAGIMGEMRTWLAAKERGLGNLAGNAACAALKGERTAPLDLSALISRTGRTELFPLALSIGESMAHRSGLPFLTRLEMELVAEENGLGGHIMTIQPLWHDAAERNHFFTQLSWYRAPKETNEGGSRLRQDTLNAGLAYRHLSADQNRLYGLNVFFDHAPKQNHNRMSLGVDARTSQLALAANRYMPLSDWKTLDLYYEERAAAGWDLELRGQVPELPSWTASLTGYEWDHQDDGENLYGVKAELEYSPVPALALRMAVRDESQDTPTAEGALRFNWRFDQPDDLQWKPRTRLVSVKDRIYDRVERENVIRVQTRRRAASKLVVLESAGTNFFIEDGAAAQPLAVGRTLLMPVTVTTSNGVGDYARLRFAGGATLTLGQNTQVRIVPDLITLISGVIQYVSDGVITNVAVPGGTIVLHGTDIDVVSDGTDSSVRVRDGRVTFTGTVAGQTSLNPGEAAESVSGVIAGVAAGSPDYITHTDTLSAQIDRVAAPLSGVKVAPYPIEAPRIVSAGTNVGDIILIGLKFNAPVTVSGGPPRLAFTLNAHSRTVDLSAGSGTDDLMFAYTIQATDSGGSTLTVTSFDENGATLSGDGKPAVTTIADTILNLGGAIGDLVAPSGYGAVFTTDPVNIANNAAAAFNITSAEIGTTYDYSITSSGGGTPVTGAGTVTAATQSVTGLDLSGLGDGTLTVSVTLTDAATNVGPAATDTVTKDTVAPTITSVTAPADATYEP